MISSLARERAIAFPEEEHTRSPLAIRTSPPIVWSRNTSRVDYASGLKRALGGEETLRGPVSGSKAELEMPKTGTWEKFLETYDASALSFGCIVSVSGVADGDCCLQAVGGRWRCLMVCQGNGRPALVPSPGGQSRGNLSAELSGIRTVALLSNECQMCLNRFISLSSIRP